LPKPSTESIHGHDYYDIETGAFKVPLYLSAIFEHPDRRTGEARKSDRGFEQKYSREENPTVRSFERVIAKLEKGSESLGFSSGMASIASVYLSSLSSGDNIVITKESYGTTQDLALQVRNQDDTGWSGDGRFHREDTTRRRAGPRRDDHEPARQGGEHTRDCQTM
jgi:cystathionine beta-lyase/cystathionine gamma-synthase